MLKTQSTLKRWSKKRENNKPINFLTLSLRDEEKNISSGSNRMWLSMFYKHFMFRRLQGICWLHKTHSLIHSLSQLIINHKNIKFSPPFTSQPLATLNTQRIPQTATTTMTTIQFSTFPTSSFSSVDIFNIFVCSRFPCSISSGLFGSSWWSTRNWEQKWKFRNLLILECRSRFIFLLVETF